MPRDFIVLPQRFLGKLKIIGALLTGIVIQIILALTTALVFAGIFVIRNLSIPAITDARIALNLIAMNYVLSLFHLIAKHYLNHLTFVLDVLMKKSVKRNHAYYTAHRAHAEYSKQLHDARAGIRTSPERLMELNDLLMPLVNKGQSINHIFASHGKEIGLSEKTIYNYIDQHAFHIRNIDLPKKVRYRQRQNRPHEVLMKMDYKCRQGRTYTDFTSYMEQNPKLSIVEMDTVIGARGSGNVLMTMLFRNTNFMLIFLLPDKSQASVNAVFDKLTLLLGLDLFRKLFPVILTDNGTEFKGVHNLEFTENGARRTRIFYCDPQASWQKGRIEKNHVLIRQILPKGTKFSTLSDESVHLITEHINSVTRELFENQTPFDLMSQKDEYKKLLDTLGLQPIPLNEVCLKPALLKRK